METAISSRSPNIARQLVVPLLTLVLSLGFHQSAVADFRVEASPQGTLVIGSSVNPQHLASGTPFPELMRQVEKHIQEKIATQMPSSRLAGRVSFELAPDRLHIELRAARGRPCKTARSHDLASPFLRIQEIIAAELGRLPPELVTIKVRHLVEGWGYEDGSKIHAGSGRSLPGPELARLIKEQAGRYGVQPALVQAVICCESNFDAHAVSPKGAKGLMQLMPGTITLLRVKNPFNMGQNIAGGTAYLRFCLDRFHQDLRLALAAYNAGPSQVAKYGTIPPFQETRLFVRRVLAEYSRLSQGRIGRVRSDHKSAKYTLHIPLDHSPSARSPQLGLECQIASIIIDIRPCKKFIK